MKTFILPLIVMVLFSLTGHSQTIVNGSFEEWSDSCAWNTAPVGWTNFSNLSNGPDQRGMYCDGNIVPYDGDHYMGLVGCAGFGITIEGAQQELSNLIVGEMYTVSFYAIACDFTIYGVDLKVWAYIDSVPVFESNYLIKNEPWTQYQFTFIAETTSADLAFLTSDWGNECSVASVGIDLVTIHQGVGISEGNTTDFRIYPNPVSEILFIDHSMEFDQTIRILDVSGNCILETIVSNHGIDVSTLEAGVYFIQLENGLSKVQRFVKR